MGKAFYAGVIIFLLLVVGALLYPTIYSITSSADVTGFLDITKAGMIFLSYAFIMFIIYAVYRMIKGD